MFLFRSLECSPFSPKNLKKKLIRDRDIVIFASIVSLTGPYIITLQCINQGWGEEGGFPLAFMSRTPDNFHGKQKESRTKSLPYNRINLATRNLSKSPTLISIYLYYSVLSLARQTVAQKKAQNISNTSPSISGIIHCSHHVVS